jgi:hypothetical protein
MPKDTPAEVYGEPLSDDEILESARLTFRMLDENEKGYRTR